MVLDALLRDSVGHLHGFFLRPVGRNVDRMRESFGHVYDFFSRHGDRNIGRIPYSSSFPARMIRC